MKDYRQLRDSSGVDIAGIAKVASFESEQFKLSVPAFVGIGVQVLRVCGYSPCLDIHLRATFPRVGWVSLFSLPQVTYGTYGWMGSVGPLFPLAGERSLPLMFVFDIKGKEPEFQLDCTYAVMPMR